MFPANAKPPGDTPLNVGRMFPVPELRAVVGKQKIVFPGECSAALEEFLPYEERARPRARREFLFIESKLLGNGESLTRDRVRSCVLVQEFDVITKLSLFSRRSLKNRNRLSRHVSFLFPIWVTNG